MTSRSPDILFKAEYIKNVLYFATVRQGKTLKNTADTHYFCIDNELVYENYYSDFGPLNLGCVYKYCRILNEKLKQYLNKQTIVHYTSIDPKKKANSAFLLGCYGVLYLSLTPKDALKPLMVLGQSYRPFQDATQGDSTFTISLMDCLQAIKKARELGFFNFQDFNYEEYDRLDKIQGGDLNWIVPGKFLAFIGPVDYSVSLFHPPEMYIEYFLNNNVKIVIRLNKRLYDGNVFNNVGIIHYDLFFPDGSCPPRHILFKFLQISEEASCALAVHCKAGLGRTGSLIGCYLIKHYRMTSHEAIGWMRICRPGSVIGHQQGWLEKLEPWLIKQGNLYRKRTYQDTEKMPLHEFGVYSIAEKNMKQRPVVFHKSPSPPPPLQKQVRSDVAAPMRPQNSRIKEAFSKATEKECDWRVKTHSMDNSHQKMMYRGDPYDSINNISRRSSGAGDPKAGRPNTRSSTIRSPTPRESLKSSVRESESKSIRTYTPITTYRTSQAPVIKNVNDARNYLMRSSIYSNEREKQLNSTVMVTPHYMSRPQNNSFMNAGLCSGAHIAPSSYSSAPKNTGQPQPRRRLGRSPSPPVRMLNEQSRATNTPSPTEKFLVKDASKSALKDVLSRLKLSMCRDGSLGAASLGANRDAPAPRRAPSVRSDERPLATQGDMLNSIKFQRRLRETINAEKSGVFHEKVSLSPTKPNIKNVDSRTFSRRNVAPRTYPKDFSGSREKQNSISRSFYGPARPMSP
ncbi:tyrosine-protein phosphatase cdcA-like [Helicoverpa zea]|uniref:tyrosine-protein phosphatase cdcA-like n=1 Tax=Helicoverpa zea TaxID=7113 RepID=UPI001F5AEA68|nr:tyrosine-protein phosphatase cdcA-like [Helicoverpa zea]